MSGRDILNIFPSSGNMVLMKLRIANATKGLSMLKRKRDALELHRRHLKAELQNHRNKVEDVMREALLALAKAKFLSTDFRPTAIERPDIADSFVRVKHQKVVGMNVSSLELIMRPVTSLPLTGLARGGQQVEIVRERFKECLKLLVSIASLELNITLISEAVKKNNRRVNGLEFVILPRFQRTFAYIRDELDEFEREEFYRLKRSQAKQKQKKEEFALKMKQRISDYLDHTEIDVDMMHYQMVPAEHIGLRGSISTAVRRKTIPNVFGKKVILLPEDQMKPVIIRSMHKLIRPGEEEEDIVKKKVVITSTSSSLSSLSSN